MDEKNNTAKGNKNRKRRRGEAALMTGPRPTTDKADQADISGGHEQHLPCVGLPPRFRRGRTGSLEGLLGSSWDRGRWLEGGVDGWWWDEIGRQVQAPFRGQPFQAGRPPLAVGSPPFGDTHEKRREPNGKDQDGAEGWNRIVSHYRMERTDWWMDG